MENIAKMIKNDGNDKNRSAHRASFLEGIKPLSFNALQALLDLVSNLCASFSARNAKNRNNLRGVFLKRNCKARKLFKYMNPIP